MSTITVEEAQAKLPEIIASLVPGEAIVITRDHQPVATLTKRQTAGRKSRQPGTAKGHLEILADDEEHLQDFKEYMG
jgi:antitoxin (DNA-binding transcriptional repressor) of toxin-antitoxin stability system